MAPHNSAAVGCITQIFNHGEDAILVAQHPACHSRARHLKTETPAVVHILDVVSVCFLHVSR